MRTGTANPDPLLTSTPYTNRIIGILPACQTTRSYSLQNRLLSKRQIQSGRIVS